MSPCVAQTWRQEECKNSSRLNLYQNNSIGKSEEKDASILIKLHSPPPAKVILTLIFEENVPRVNQLVLNVQFAAHVVPEKSPRRMHLKHSGEGLFENTARSYTITKSNTPTTTNLCYHRYQNDQQYVLDTSPVLKISNL